LDLQRGRSIKISSAGFNEVAEDAPT